MARRFLAGRGWRHECVSGMWFKPHAAFDENKSFIEVCAQQRLYGHHIEEALMEQVCGWHVARSSWMAVAIGAAAVGVLWVAAIGVLLTIVALLAVLDG